ncbi:TCR/Tet family MFS transporter [Ferruginibacter albus]|uniref:TCR/Tet family MFS transporter n=1 Tax=Ferruginibacter albus TaxID=2875540 RepID=UPI001CC4D5F3|nr:TCR/Tet family MFS transporter [Ferruginibacter albus]UAY50975.1 TCR/Tet family MFS transporter [Ferruginibacter albus]
MSTKKNAAVGFIFITLLIDVIGFSIIIPVMPTLISSLKHVNASAASRYGSYLLSAYAVVQFFCAPILGSLSDKYGRRPVLLFSLFGFGIDYLFMAFSPSYGWLFVGRIIAGITGASFSTAGAYIADISTAETRTKNFGMIGAAFGLGFFVGPAIGGLIGKLGDRAPFYVSAALALLNWVYGYFVLPESLKKENRREFSWKRANPVGALQHLIKYPALKGLMVAIAFLNLASWAVQGNWSYYGVYRFHWDKPTIGISISIVGLLIGLVQAGLTRVVNPKLGNEKSIYTGLFFYAIGMFLFGIAPVTWLMFAFLVPYCLGGIAQPALQSIMATHVPPNAQGELQGALTSIMSAMSIIGPLIMNNLFFYFTNENRFHIILPGAPFFLGTIFFVCSAFIAYNTLKHDKHLVHDPISK